MKQINKDEFDKLLNQAYKAVLYEGYSQEEAQELCQIISNKFDEFLGRKFAKTNARIAKYHENEQLTKCTHYCFPFRASLIRLEFGTI
jgi:hypothetical protein